MPSWAAAHFLLVRPRDSGPFWLLGLGPCWRTVGETDGDGVATASGGAEDRRIDRAACRAAGLRAGRDRFPQRHADLAAALAGGPAGRRHRDERPGGAEPDRQRSARRLRSGRGALFA